MKLLNLLILFFLTLSCNGNRNENPKGKLSVDYLIENTQTKIKTADLLEHLSWSQLIQDCQLKKGVCEEYKMDSVLTKFSFKRKETKNEISITSYKGEILAFNKTQLDEFHDKEIRYFEKSLWFASKEVVKTCGNSGSYKFYSELPIELISKKMVPEIIESYDHFLNEN